MTRAFQLPELKGTDILHSDDGGGTAGAGEGGEKSGGELGGVRAGTVGWSWGA